MAERPASERIILAVDRSTKAGIEQLTGVAEKAGAFFVKYGLESSTAEDWRFCSSLASEYDIDWVADAKLDDIPNTVVKAVKNIRSLLRPPFAITMHTSAGVEAMRAAQRAAGPIKMLGVTVLTSLSDRECYETNVPTFDPNNPPSDEEMAAFRRDLVMHRARLAARAGLAGIVASPQEVGMIKTDPETSHLFAMIPGIRSASDARGDQARVGTAEETIKNGADLLVIGRPIIDAPDPAAAYGRFVREIEGAMA